MEDLYPVIIITDFFLFPLGWFFNLRAGQFVEVDVQKTVGNSIVGFGTLFIATLMALLPFIPQGNFNCTYPACVWGLVITAFLIALISSAIIVFFASKKESY
jgi:hypothetical protein